MRKARLTISLHADLARRIRRAAGEASVSAWLAHAVAARLRSEGWLPVVQDGTEERAAVTIDELEAAEWRNAPRRRGRGRSPRARPSRSR